MVAKGRDLVALRIKEIAREKQRTNGGKSGTGKGLMIPPK